MVGGGGGGWVTTSSPYKEKMGDYVAITHSTNNYAHHCSNYDGGIEDCRIFAMETAQIESLTFVVNLLRLHNRAVSTIELERSIQGILCALI